MLSKIQIDLIETIRNQHLVTSTYLSNCLVCSKRSIISYVKEINQEYPLLIRSTKKGYYLDEEIFKKIAEEYQLNQQYSTEDRIFEIFRCFFLSGNDTVNINDLSFSLFVSDSTIRSDIYSLKRNSDQKISISLNKAIAKLQGEEKEKRNFYFSYIYRHIRKSFYDEDIYESFFPRLEISGIKKKIHEELNHYKISVDDYLFDSLLLQIIIPLVRILTGHPIQERIELPKHVQRNDIECADRIARYLMQSYQAEYTEAEIGNIGLLMASYDKSYSVADISLENLDQYLWPGLYSLFTEIVETLKNRYKIDILKKPSNAIGLALHLRSLIHRSAINVFADNPLTSSIRNIYPISYECLIYIARKIFDYFQFLITEDEITFLAVYIANNMRLLQNIKSKISVLFLIPDYNIITSELYDYYSEHFDSDIKAVLLTEKEKIESSAYDLLITTDQNFDTYGSAPVIYINPFINSADENHLKEIIEQLKKQKRLQYNRVCLASFMKEEFYYERDFSDFDEAFSMMTDQLQQKGIASQDLKEDILVRAKLSNTVVNSIALLRPCVCVSSAHSFSYLKLKEPVYFNGEKISAIMLLSFSENKFLDYLHVMEYLFYQISDKNKARKILEADSFQQLTDLLCQ